MFSVSSFYLIISGGEEKKLFEYSKRSFYGMICVSVWTLCCSCAVETYVKGYLPQDSFNGLLHFALL